MQRGRRRNTAMISAMGLAALGALAYAILWKEGVLRDNRRVFLSAGLIFCAMLLRSLCMEHESLDYRDFLLRWVEYFRDHGGFRALDRDVGNYNVPYLYFMALFSYSSIKPLYLIKLLSVLFDVLLAWGALRLTRTVSGSERAGMIAFLLTLLLPTVILNGAYWGQCDSIYTAFGVWSFALALEDRPIPAVAAIALSFSFKLQAVFLMPVFLIFIFAGKIKWEHLAVFPLTYLAVVLPAVLLGRPLWDTLSLYFNQAGTVGSALNYNSSSVYAFAPWNPSNPEELARAGILAAFAFLLLLYGWCWYHRRRLNRRNLLYCCLLISVAVPFLLPHMHDRYFFPADVLSLVLAACFPPLAPVAPAVSFASLLGYYAYIKMRFLLPMRYGAFALLAVIALLVLLLVSELAEGGPAGRPARSRSAGSAAGRRVHRSGQDYNLQAGRIQARKRSRGKSQGKSGGSRGTAD